MEFLITKQEAALKDCLIMKGSSLKISGVGRTFPDPNFDATLLTQVWAQFYNFEYVTSGTGYIEIDDRVYTVTAGDFFFFSKNSKRRLYSDKNDPMEKLYVLVKGPFVDGIIQAYSLPLPFFICKVPVQENFLEIIRIIQEAEEYTTEVEDAVADELLTIIRKVARKEVQKKVACNSAMIIKEYIEWALSENLSIDSLSKKVFLGKTQIINVFKKHYGVTPMKYIRNRRIEVAKDYLANTNIQIQKIPDLIGMCDERYFSTVFKTATGMTPREYRKTYKNPSPV